MKQATNHWWRTTAAIGLLGVSVIVGCTYDPPPTVSLDLPPGGVYPIGSDLVLQFNEPIQPESLIIRVWPASPDDITIENEFVADLEPTVASCSVTSESCTHATLSMAEDGKSATLQIDGAPFEAFKVPWRLEIATGLKDLDGNSTGVSHFFDFQFSPCPENSTEEVDFQDGYYLLTAEVEEPLPVVLTLYNQITVLNDGRFRWIGVDGNIKDGFAKNTSNPDEIYLNLTDNAFGLFAKGVVSGGNGERCLASEPFQVLIRIDALEIVLSDVRLNGAVLADGTIEGTISFEALSLDTGGEPFVYPPGSASFFAKPLTPEQLPEGLPDLCTSLCGQVTAQCDPPSGFASPEFCPVEPDE